MQDIYKRYIVMIYSKDIYDRYIVCIYSVYIYLLYIAWYIAFIYGIIYSIDIYKRYCLKGVVFLEEISERRAKPL